jgi:hypothetical protein
LQGHNLVELPLVVLVVVPVPQEEVFTSVLTESCRDSSLRGHSTRTPRRPCLRQLLSFFFHHYLQYGTYVLVSINYVCGGGWPQLKT